MEEGPLSAHFFRKFRTHLVTTCGTGPDFALLALLLDTYGEEVEFRCARPRQSSGAVGICKIYGHAVGVSIWSGLPD